MRLSISQRISLLICCLILAVSIGLGSIGIKLSSSSILNQTKDALSISANDGVEIIEGIIGKDVAVLSELARHESIKTMDWHMQHQYLISNISRLGFLDMGVVTYDGTAYYASKDATAYLGDEDYIKKALQGQSNVSDVFISSDTNEAVYIIAAPIERDNIVVGVLIAVKDGITLSNVIDNMGFGNNGYAFILGSDGTVYAHKDRSYVKNQRNIFKDIETNGDFKNIGLEMQKLGMGNRGIINYDLLGSKRIMGIEPIPSTGWVLAIGAHESDALSGLNRLRRVLIIGTMVFITIGLIVSALLGSYISKPIIEYSKIIEGLSNYDLRFDEKSRALKYAKRKDEIGHIGNSLINMNGNLKSLVKQISEISEQVALSSDGLTATSQQSSNASEEIVRAIEDISQGANEQAIDTEKTAAIIEELGNLIDRNKRDVDNLISAIEAIKCLKEEGLQVVKDLVEKTQSSGEAVKNVNSVILSTNEKAKKIQSASQMIKNIADQTNLLALNAAIEAARAGKAGKGFAVVAQEIRKLAEGSNKFTGEIEEIIRELTAETGMAIDVMEDARKVIELQAESVEVTNEKYAGIAISIEDMKKYVGEINKSEQLMEAKKNDVIQIMQNLSAIAQENAAATEEVYASVEEQTAAIAEIADASEALARMSDEMRQSIIKFKY
ncbi:methyl-accepting chemotaxis protein [Lutispora thermophila]|uniref:Methyl-accepting chemotaxis sensory transducer with Cache sensor n=1 Tax=Lutispora thermophila DSM 19022 TaxID=1122184 RepID=A0A1M6FQK4_9FIRM|nr:methyl-accepting chemotaxis protein [Lutispora thermophila]SHI99992.1 methyl-accepting chemotaxis sensory transducer with Cache sensor [Lutispora thermophila DSM 19022]